MGRQAVRKRIRGAVVDRIHAELRPLTQDGYPQSATLFTTIGLLQGSSVGTVLAVEYAMAKARLGAANG